MLWGRLLTWIDKDSVEVILPRVPLNIGNLIGGVFGLVLFFMLPGYAIALLVYVFIVMVEAGIYLGMRNSKVGLSDLNGKFKDWLGSLKGGEKEVKVIQGEVQLIGKGGKLMPAPESDDPVLPAYETVQTLFTEPLRRNAERIDLAPSENGSIIRYMVDGVGYSGATVVKDRAQAAIEYIKLLSGLDTSEKRKPQTGAMKVSVDGQKRDVQVLTAGSSSGEQLRATIDPKKKHQQRLEQLGMSPEQFDIVKTVIENNTGVVLVAAPKGQGLTTMLYAILRGHDAFLQHIQTIETDAAADLEGINQNKLPPNASPADELKSVAWCISQEPDVIMVSKCEDTKVALALNKYASTGKRVYIGLRAGSTFDALAVWRKLIGDDRVAIKDLRLVVCGRVIRKLCSACKAGYTPDPQTLRKLNMDPDTVGQLYQARTQPMRDPKGNPVTCEFCKELYFKGRVGVYEVFFIDDDARAVLEAGGSSNQLKAVFRKQRAKYLQESALAQVEAGETSVQEVLRIMKSDDKPPGGKRPPSGPKD
jgi:type II secretory ATPase GspE/PulE/Tfp pilus assembly ATPase PilB-like protein